MSNILIDIRLEMSIYEYKLDRTYYNWNDFCFLDTKESGILSIKHLLLFIFTLGPTKNENNYVKSFTTLGSISVDTSSDMECLTRASEGCDPGVCCIGRTSF